MKTPSIHGKTRIIIPALAIVSVLLLLLAACGTGTPSTGENPQNEEPTVIDFANGNYSFMRSYESSPDAAHIVLSQLGGEVGEDGVAAAIEGVLASPAGNGTMYLAIDAGSLLGSHVSDVYDIAIKVGVQNPDGEFHAVSGEITAMIINGETTVSSNDPWSVYLPTKNPNVAHGELFHVEEKFVQGAYNFILLTKDVDNALLAGQTQSNLIISEIRFLDELGNPLGVNPDAGFNAPEGFGKQDRSNLTELDGEVALPNASGTSNGWGQAVGLDVVKNGGAFDGAALTPGVVVSVYYSAETPPELILQSWTAGAPETAGWAKVAPFAVNNGGNIAQYRFEDMALAFGTEYFGDFLDKVNVGDTGSELKVFSVSVGREHS
ncbi:MAG: hypothetical protein LBN30_07890 [Oscillospiraceae bacterium]|nr:hypothetical protein [Oscillospiraceae bacterium]